MTEGIFPKQDGDILYASEANGLVPVGTVLPWVKSLTNTPTLSGQFVECNGQVLSDADSVYNGVTMPNLNGGTYRMLRGASTSGGTGGSDTINIAHTHAVTQTGGGSYGAWGSGSNAAVSDSKLSATQSVLPCYYEVVFIIRVK